MVNISTMANDEEVDEVFRELFDLWFVPVNANKCCNPTLKEV
jgi:hypothetical protein